MQLYEPGGIPGVLHDAHRELDRVVDKLIAGRSRVATDADRLRVLFRKYQELITDGQLVVEEQKRRNPRSQ